MREIYHTQGAKDQRQAKRNQGVGTAFIEPVEDL
jgi:hypothetical protein